ncbi:MAG: ABC transporter ATP-binding protein [Flammeovirgaceae bacterium]|nr:ABC transporter ATP-binding protein [Flammeovirgaceae bacterium]
MEENKPFLVQTNHLSVGYTNRTSTNILFENLNLSLEKGKLVCFMGPNGIGKSTLIRTLSGLQSPLRGSVSGVSVKNISVVLTDRVEANLSVFEFVSFGRYPYLPWHIQLTDEDFATIKQCMEQVRISDLRDRKLYELSDGQIQMTAIARALAQSTPVLLLDEPTAHLDLNNRVEIMNLLRRLAHDSGKAILVSTHELDLALQTSDWIWLATRKKTILTGMPEDLVLEGAFDETFQFKGFDLKPGRSFTRQRKINRLSYRAKELPTSGRRMHWKEMVTPFSRDRKSTLKFYPKIIHGFFLKELRKL